MTIYLVKGSLDSVATTLADAMLLFAALDDPNTAASAATIDRVTGKLETLVQRDTGEPLVISSIDDAAGTVSSWVTDAAITLQIALGYPDASGSWVFAQTSDFTIVGNTRVGSLPMNGEALASALARAGGRGCRSTSFFTLHILKDTAGAKETVGLFQVRVRAGVFA